MAQSVIWSQEALDDIDNIAEYIGRDSIYHAQQVVEQIFDLSDTLLKQSQLGRVVPELNNPYRLIYEIKEPEIHIMAVIHGKRLLETIEERFGLDT